MESHRLYVGNLNHGMNEDALRELFTEFGTLTEVRIHPDGGFGFVTYETLEGAERAREAMAGKTVDGRPLRVEDARPVFQSERKP